MPNTFEPPTTPGAYMRHVRETCRISKAEMARQVAAHGCTCYPGTIRDMEAGKTLGTIRHRKALAAWAQERDLLRPGESWWEAVNRALIDAHVSKAIGRAVGAGLTTCPSCGAKLDEVTS